MTAVYMVSYPYGPNYAILGCYEDFDDAIDCTRDPEVIERFGTNTWVTEMGVQRGDQTPYRRILYGPCSIELIRIDLEGWRMIYYRQCKLVRDSVETVSWIPEKFAVKGQKLTLKDDGKWTGGWKVEQVYQRIPDHELPHPPKQIRGHRDSTGDAEPKHGVAKPD